MEQDLSITNDVVFRHIFSNKRFLISFLEVVMGVNIKNISILDDIKTYEESIKDKVSILDILAEVNEKVLVDVEMQNVPHKDYTKRIFVYLGNLIKKDMHSGDEYNMLKDIVIINILNENIFDGDEYHTLMKFRDSRIDSLNELDGIEIHFLELKKFRNKKNQDTLENSLEEWLAVIDGKNQRWLNMALKHNKVIEEVEKERKKFGVDDSGFWDGFTRYKMDYVTDIKLSKEEGIEEGKKDGLKDGLKAGKEEGTKEVAKRMLKDNVDLKTIARYTKLTREQIEIIRSKFN